MAPAVDVPEGDPLEILMACESADEAEGCECGKHLAEWFTSRECKSD